MKPTSATISFRHNGITRTLDLLAPEGNEYIQVTASIDDAHTKIDLAPKFPIEVTELLLTFPYTFDQKDYIFMNGYQSWTVCKEYSIDTTNLFAERIARVMRHKKTDHCGDRTFTDYPKMNRWLHGVSYGYVRQGEDFRFFGSLNEQQGFTFFDIDTDAGTLSVRKDLTGRLFSSAFTASEIAFYEGTEKEVFDRYFEAMDITSTDAPPITGYTTWYSLQQDLSEKKLMPVIESVASVSERFPCQLFCIDEGYESAIGDWLTPKKNAFPHGLYPITKKIMREGMKAGIWLAPFICEKKSKIFKEHNDWLLRDSHGNPVHACHSWHNCYCLDIENPAFLNHLKNVLLTMRDDWGVSVFKFDFLYAACMLPSSTHTRGEKITEAIRFLRECVGNSTIIACGAPLLACAGVVDYCQVSCDLSPDWFPPLAQASREQNSTYRALVDLIYHRQLAGRAFTLFTNVLPLSNTAFLFPQEKRFLLGRAMGICQGMLLTSDDIAHYDAEDTVAWNTIHALREADIKSIYTKDHELIVEYELYKQPQRLKFPLME